MSDKHVFQATKRVVLGKGVKKLRREGLLIGCVFVANDKSLPLTANLKAFAKLHDLVGESGLVYLKIDHDDKEERPVLIDEIQYHPVNGRILHVSFREVSLKEKVKAEVALKFVGQVEVKDGVVVTVKDSVEVSALPTDLPDKIEVDISGLTEIGQNITLADLSYDQSKVSLVLPEDQKPEDVVLVLVQEQREDVVEEVPETEAVSEEGAPVADGEEKPSEGGEAKTEAVGAGQEAKSSETKAE